MAGPFTRDRSRSRIRPGAGRHDAHAPDRHRADHLRRRLQRRPRGRPPPRDPGDATRVRCLDWRNARQPARHAGAIGPGAQRDLSGGSRDRAGRDRRRQRHGPAGGRPPPSPSGRLCARRRVGRVRRHGRGLGTMRNLPAGDNFTTPSSRSTCSPRASPATSCSPPASRSTGAAGPRSGRCGCRSPAGSRRTSSARRWCSRRGLPSLEAPIAS